MDITIISYFIIIFQLQSTHYYRENVYLRAMTKDNIVKWFIVKVESQVKGGDEMRRLVEKCRIVFLPSYKT